MFDDKSCNITFDTQLCAKFLLNNTHAYPGNVPSYKLRLVEKCTASYVKYLCFKLYPIHDMFNDTTLSNLPEQTQKKVNIMNSHVV